ncbi:hypothetical protein [Streptomyces sp. NPDC012510]|uniref:hypothetical protein n=1 Tax=Streptomyces sp. NPDC012510 TaxID=3364838 RepID=UPI0036EFBDAC
MTAGWGSRAVRAAMFAAVCVLLAALGHVMMSGSQVPWWAMATGAVATGAVGWCLAGRERGLPLITSVVVAAQTALHWGFELAPSPGGTVPPSRTGPMGSGHMTHAVHPGAAGHMDHVDHVSHLDHTGSLLDALDRTGPLLDGPYASSSSLLSGLVSLYASSSGMFAAHLLAALLCGLWLAYGERAVFRMLRAVAGWLAAPLRLSLALPATPERPRPRVRRGRTGRSPRRLLLVHAITSRGPPAGTAVV